MPIKILNSQDGFALIGSMLFLVVLTIIGIAATNTTSIEVGIAGNERVYKQNFYLAEGTAKEAAKEDLESGWVWEANKNDLPLDGGGSFDIDAVFTETSGLGAGISFGVVDNDIPSGVLGSGHSLKVEGTGTGGRMNFFDLYGQSTEDNSMVRIVMGYTKRL
ncbi:MAG: pilus assembly PilX N-terminal domain-containing protein [Desulfobacula sp.]|uniref:pilus assembly PilX N-terminal domain-containing protein n=1 Tax=Desulfobacula sp. TaxID=2593537 RepID=UPI0025C67660|nr:pilus assembly PilX N-terminal domain-containing protein [Desulfobacula sp.]MCD4718377.1 pilus assembly PilX N-terminal domain-containing protein [Desulfobacula sp.]